MSESKFTIAETKNIDWSQRIREAMKVALDVAALEKIKDEQDRMTASFIRGEVPGADFDNRMKQLEVLQGAVRSHTIEDFEACLRCYPMSEREVSELVEHEGAHFETARSKGLEPHFQVQFARDDGNKMPPILYPSIGFDFPHDMPDEVRIRILREIIEAPEDLSPRDKTQLGNI